MHRSWFCAGQFKDTRDLCQKEHEYLYQNLFWLRKVQEIWHVFVAVYHDELAKLSQGILRRCNCSWSLTPSSRIVMYAHFPCANSIFSEGTKTRCSRRQLTFEHLPIAPSETCRVSQFSFAIFIASVQMGTCFLPFHFQGLSQAISGPVWKWQSKTESWGLSCNCEAARHFVSLPRCKSAADRRVVNSQREKRDDWKAIHDVLLVVQGHLVVQCTQWETKLLQRCCA